MSELLEKFGLMLVGGLFVQLIKWTWLKFWLPAIRSHIYSIPKIEGDWLSYDANPRNGAVQVGVAKVFQRGDLVTMTLERTRSRSGKNVHRVFSYSGRFEAGQLTLLFADNKAKGVITGALVLKMMGDGKTFEGKTTYLDHDSGKVVSYDFWIARQ